MNWYSAKAYCEWLNEQQKANNSDLSLKFIKGKSEQKETNFRLPTEEEWEWAASGGKREYPWGNEKPDDTRANYERKVGQTTPVGSYPNGATPEGLMDMAGNVFEWMENWYDEDKDARAVRGGSWNSNGGYLRCAVRYRDVPAIWYDFFGFRLVCAQS